MADWCPKICSRSWEAVGHRSLATALRCPIVATLGDGGPGAPTNCTLNRTNCTCVQSTLLAPAHLHVQEDEVLGHLVLILKLHLRCCVIRAARNESRLKLGKLAHFREPRVSYGFSPLVIALAR
jgi:hypothetical protein